jgi:beta-glucosidase
MTLAEKASRLRGVPEPSSSDQGEAVYLAGVRLDIQPLRIAVGTPGVLTHFPATALTATLGLAATSSREDARDNGAVIERDAPPHAWPSPPTRAGSRLKP